MTMPYSPSRAIYEGNNAATRFPFSFKVWDASQLVVTLTSPDGLTTQASGWTANLGAAGGEIVYQHDNTPLPDGWKLAITRNMPFTQEVNLVSASRFDPQVIEDALDQATAERQQTLEMMRRAVILPATSSETPQDVVLAVYAARDNATAAASSASASQSAAAASAVAAADSAATAAQTVAAATATAVAAATAQASRAEFEADLARRWASEDEGVTVAGDYSAKHYAAKAKEAVPENLVQRVTDVETVASEANATANAAKAVTDTATPTPTPNAVLQADAGGHINTGWIGTMLCNVRTVITTSGTYTHPTEGWASVTCIGGGGAGGGGKTNYGGLGGGTTTFKTVSAPGGGGGGAGVTSQSAGGGGAAGLVETHFIYLVQGESVDVYIGAGGLGTTTATTPTGLGAGTNIAAGLIGGGGGVGASKGGSRTQDSSGGKGASGGNGANNGTQYGGGGGGAASSTTSSPGIPGVGGFGGNTGSVYNGDSAGGNGGNGAVIIEYFNPSLAG